MRADRMTSGRVPRTYSTVVNAGGCRARRQYRAASASIHYASSHRSRRHTCRTFRQLGLDREGVGEATHLPAVVVGYGTSETAPAHVLFLTLPSFIDYGKWGPKLAERFLLTALNLLYYAPIVPLAWCAWLIYRPRVLLANGVNSAGFLGPLTRFGPRLVLAFHGSIENAGTGGTAFFGARRRRFRSHSSTPREAPTTWRTSSIGRGSSRRALGRRRLLSSVDRASSIRAASGAFRRPARHRKFEQCLRVCTRLGAEGVTELVGQARSPPGFRAAQGSSLWAM